MLELIGLLGLLGVVILAIKHPDRFVFWAAHPSSFYGVAVYGGLTLLYAWQVMLGGANPLTLFSDKLAFAFDNTEIYKTVAGYVACENEEALAQAVATQGMSSACFRVQADMGIKFLDPSTRVPGAARATMAQPDGTTREVWTSVENRQ